VKEKRTVGFSIFWVFPSDRIPKATKDANVHFFIHSLPQAVIPVNYTSEFREIFEATMYTQRFNHLQMDAHTHLWKLLFIHCVLKAMYQL
jgi:hypothetical protein